MKYVFGPVPSRRLGLSLGIDLVPYKTCSFDCVYCECGKTTKLIKQRKKFVPLDKLYIEIKEKLEKTQKIDYITFSGSGEPTLNSDIGEVIKFLKKNYKYKVAVLTNGSLLYKEKVRTDLMNADLVIPSLDAVTSEIYKKINKPVKNLKIEQIIEGIISFSNEFKGKIFLEILFVKEINDGIEEIEQIIEIVKQINPDKIQLNTNVRPGTVKSILPLNDSEMKKIKNLFVMNGFYKSKIEISSGFNNQKNIDIDAADIINIIERRPLTIKDISELTKKTKLEIIKIIDFIKKNNKIKLVELKQNNELYYKIKK